MLHHCLGETLNVLRLFCTHNMGLWSFDSSTVDHVCKCQYKSVYLYCMLFLLLSYPILLPQPLLHNANTNQTDPVVETDELISRGIKIEMLVKMLIQVLYHHLL